MKKSIFIFACSILISGVTSSAKAQDDANKEDPVTASIEGHVFKPVQKKATEENVKKLKTPAGFTVTKFAEDLGNSRMMATGKDGAVYVTSRDEGKVTMLRDTDKDGKADVKKVILNLKDVHGIAIHENKVYLATVTELYSADLQKDGGFGQLKKIYDDLPDGGQHPNRTISFGPDNMMYVSIGSTCNACEETNPEHATIIRAKPDGSSRKVFAKGLRNTLGFDWHPQTKEMYGMDHGIDWLGDEAQREELNKLEEGKDYGWPYVYEDGKPVPHREPKGKTHEEYAKTIQFPLLTHEAHSSGMGMKFYTGSQFPAEYKNDAFVAFRGSWNRSKPSGYKVVRVRFEDNKPVGFEDFLTGFLLEDGRSHFGRIVDIAIHSDGSLLVTDDSNGVVYRVAYNGSK